LQTAEAEREWTVSEVDRRDELVTSWDVMIHYRKQP